MRLFNAGIDSPVAACGQILSSAAVLTALAILAGCVSLPQDDLLTGEEVDSFAARVNSPVDLRVAIGARVDHSRWKPGPGAGRSHSVPIDWEDLAKDVFIALDRADLFRRVQWVDAGSPDEAVASFAARSEALDADALILIEPSKSVVAYEGRNALFWPNLLLWLLLWFPSAVVPDEVYSAQAGVTVRILDPRSGAEIASFEVSARNERWLDEFSRGYTAWGTVLAPIGLGGDNYLEAARLVMPQAVRELKNRLLRVFAEDVRGVVEDPGFKSRLTPRKDKRLALVIGVSDYADPAFPDPKYASADAEAVRARMSDRQDPSGPGWDIALLTDGKASLEAVEAALDRLAKEPLRPEDSVLVYFSGLGRPGTAGSHGPLIALCDAKESDPNAGVLSVSRLAGLLDGLEAGSVALLIDASFSSSRDGRSLGGAPVQKAGSGPAPLPLAGSRITLALAGGLSGPAYEVEPLGSGLFTKCLLDALDGDSDSDADGSVTLPEMKTYVEERVPFMARMIGLNQKPAVFCKDGAAFPWTPRQDK